MLVIVLTMSLVAVLTSDILIYTLLGVLSVYLMCFYCAAADFRRTGHYDSYAGNVSIHGVAYFDDGYGGTACDWYAARRSSGRFQENTRS